MSRKIESTAATPRSRRRTVGLGAAALLMLFVSLVVAIALSEAVVRIAKPGFPGFKVPQVEHRPVAGLGFEMVPNQVAFSTASHVRINSAGFRGAEIRADRAAGDLRVLCLGDSMTFGVAVEDDETYASRLEEVLKSSTGRRAEVINAGVQRYFTFQEIDLLEKEVDKLRPQVVTLAVYINDLGVRPKEDFVRQYENEREQAATAFRRRFPLVYLAVKNSALVELSKNTYLMLKESRRPRPNIVQDALAGRVRPRDEPRWRGLEQELVTFGELARTHDFHPVVLFIPVRAQLQQEFPDSLYPRRLIDHARSLGIATIDLAGVFRQSLQAGNDPFLPWDEHMSVTGHRLVAETIAAELRRDALPRIEQSGNRVASHPAASD